MNDVEDMKTLSDVHDLLAHSVQEEAITVAFLQQPGGPVRLRVLEDISGFSRTTFLLAITEGRLRATRQGLGRGRWMVSRAEAVRYLRTLNIAA